MLDQIGWTKCIVAHPTKILGGHPAAPPMHWLTALEANWFCTHALKLNVTKVCWM